MQFIVTGEPRAEPDQVNAARVLDLLLGGSRNFTSDWSFAAQVRATWPEAEQTMHANRAFRLVVGVDGDSRAWVRVANALLNRIASGVVRAGSRVPPVTGLGLGSPVPAGATTRAFRMLTGEGVLHWVPGAGLLRPDQVQRAGERPAA